MRLVDPEYHAIYCCIQECYVMLYGAPGRTTNIHPPPPSFFPGPRLAPFRYAQPTGGSPYPQLETYYA
jgi:hypothetical protein